MNKQPDDKQSLTDLLAILKLREEPQILTAAEEVQNDFTNKYIVTAYVFKPTEDITAFELYHCNTHPVPFSFKTAKTYESAVQDWYNRLPPGCIKYLTSFEQVVIE